MSTNTTNTSDRVQTRSFASSPAQGEGAQKIESGGSPFAEAFPDPAVIARLANELFAALPGAPEPPYAPVSEASADPVDLRMISETLPRATVPDYPREMFSFPTAPIPRSVPGSPNLPSSPPADALNEADFRSIAASLGNVTALVPLFPADSPAPALPIPSSSSLAAEKSGPWTVAPQFPPAMEMFSFPGVPAMPSSPPTGPPGGLDLAGASTSTSPAVATTYRPPADSGDGGRTDPWVHGPNFPTQNEVFSFPRVPGASVPGIADAVPAQPNVPVSQPVLGTIPASLPAVPATNAPEIPSGVFESAVAPAIPEIAADPAGDEKIVYPGAPQFPAASEWFSFPGVPGLQSPPGVPALPVSLPTKAPTEGDFRTLPSSGNLIDAAPTPPKPTSLPGGVESFEFRPDLAPGELGIAKRPLDARLIRQDFPILQERVHGRQLIWLDNAATTQKPNAVIDRLSYFYQHENSNIHRAAHTLAARATDAYESAREKTRRFLNASSSREIIFVRGTTEGINLVAQAWGRRNVQKDDEVLITWLEHHANIVPWQQICSEKGARLRVAPVNDRGEVILEEYEKLLGPRTRIVSFSQVSNALGTITPAREMVEMAHRHGARVLVDGAQAVSHMRVDVQALDCDFYVFSGHKIFAPTGIGAVYGKLELLDTMPPWQGGGNMIADVTFEKTVYQSAPARFEAGTGNIADAVGLGAALDYVEEVGRESIAAYEHELLNYATAGLLSVPGLRLIGTAKEKAGVLSFVLDDVRTEDVGAALNQEGIAVRSGHHCAQPILRRMGVESTVRPSLALYNTQEEIDVLVAALLRLQSGREHRKL
jgi:cysteine desulfurase / selenocysteine lyase